MASSMLVASNNGCMTTATLEAADSQYTQADWNGNFNRKWAASWNAAVWCAAQSSESLRCPNHLTKFYNTTYWLLG